MSNVADYSSIYTIKDYAVKELVPKYFPTADVNELNIGLLGYTTELATNAMEDSFNTITMYMNEMFPNLAILPESIYSYAAMFQMTGLFTVPARMQTILFLTVDDVVKNGRRVKQAGDVSGSTVSDDLFEFFISSDTIIDVEGMTFLPDYDIKITYKPYRGDYSFTATYNMYEEGNVPYKNTISDITNPYIKIKQLMVGGVRYLMVMIVTHQVNKYIQNEQILSNEVINVPSFVVTFDKSLANFEVFYTPPSGGTSQLKKIMIGSPPLKEPFCYYKFIDEDKIELSFTSRDKYFQPEFNSELAIHYYTSEGEKGNFPLYKGNNVTVTASSEKYEYNGNIVFFSIPQSSSEFGANKVTLELLKHLVIEKFSTAGSYTNENDLQLYFDNFNRTYNANVFFIKTRDDLYERLFTSFSIFKNLKGDIYHTNTLNIKISTDDFDTESPQSNAYVLQPGHLFKYEDNILDSAIMVPGTISDGTIVDSQFVYTNPFLIYFISDPALLGYYLNSTDGKYIIDYLEVNDRSLVQFICNSLSVSRNAIVGDSAYTVNISVTPTSDLENPIVTEEQDIETGEIIVTKSDSLVVRIAFEDNGEEMAFLDFDLIEWDIENAIYTYECKIETDDYITINNKMRALNLYRILDTPEDYDLNQKLIPMMDAVLNIYTYYKYPDPEIPEVDTRFSDPDAPKDITYHVKTNKYSTRTNPVTFIYPVQMMKSKVSYIYNNDGYISSSGYVEGGTHDIRVFSVPLVSAKTMRDVTVANHFLGLISSQYNYMDQIIHNITNNFSTDMKFYNTYGKSKNFRVGDNSELLLDRVNISIHFKIKPTFGTDVELLTRDVKMFIKSYIESINARSTNSIYVSNLIQSLENTFYDIMYLKFVGINSFESDMQVIENVTTDLTSLTKDERIHYVPEFLTIALDDIVIDII